MIRWVSSPEEDRERLRFREGGSVELEEEAGRGALAGGGARYAPEWLVNFYNFFSPHTLLLCLVPPNRHKAQHSIPAVP